VDYEDIGSLVARFMWCFTYLWKNWWCCKIESWNNCGFFI